MVLRNEEEGVCRAVRLCVVGEDVVGVSDVLHFVKELRCVTFFLESYRSLMNHKFLENLRSYAWTLFIPVHVVQPLYRYRQDNTAITFALDVY